jgi:hypothetical protein
LLLPGVLAGAEAPQLNPVEHVRLPLFRVEQESFTGAGRDLVVPIPHPIAFAAPPELQLTLHPPSAPLTQPAAVAVAWNGRVVMVTNLNDAGTAPLALRARLPEESANKGDNVLALRLVRLGTTNAPLEEAVAAKWGLHRAECFLALDYTRTPLFEELSRFPNSLTEEKLLHPDPEPTPGARPAAAGAAPVLSLILPGISGAAHLRVAAIAGARLGQIDYLQESDCRIAALESWKVDASQRNALIIARRDQLGGVELPSPIVSSLTALTPGQGLLAEFFQGNEPREHRVLLVTGADDDGLEKAALTLGSRPAMNTLALSPAVLDRAPILYAPPDPAAHPVPIEGLYQIQQFLLTDPYARHALYAVPSAPSLGQAQLLFALWWKLGHSLPVAPVLWPEVVTFQPGAAVDFSRWPGRNVIALAPLDQWPVFLPKGTTPALRLTSPDTLTVLMQGRKQTRAELDPDLAFAQLMVSPRSITNTMILVGGWRDYAVPAVKRMLVDPASPGVLAGNLAAMDPLGRFAAYDLRHIGSESFAERVRRRIPPGVGLEETRRLLAQQDAALNRALRWNTRVSIFSGAGCVLLVALRLILMWQQTRLRKAALAATRVGGPT